MLATRVIQQSLRQLAASRSSLVSLGTVKTFKIPMAIPSLKKIRHVATQPMKPIESYEILIAQRKNRPTSPHLMIYRPQITWYLSALNRITGCMVSGGFYLFGAAYLVSPLFGWHMDSVTIAAAFGGLPVAGKFVLKSLVALPFTFHSINGIRHLTWDLGKAFTNTAVIKTGWTVVGLSLVSAVALVAFV